MILLGKTQKNNLSNSHPHRTLGRRVFLGVKNSRKSTFLFDSDWVDSTDEITLFTYSCIRHFPDIISVSFLPLIATIEKDLFCLFKTVAK